MSANKKNKKSRVILNGIVLVVGVVMIGTIVTIVEAILNLNSVKWDK